MSKQSANLKAFENQIAPLAHKLMNRCKHYGFPVMIAVSVPLGIDHDMLAFHMEPNKDGAVPPDFLAAQALLTPATPEPAIAGLQENGAPNSDAVAPPAAG